MLYGMYIGEILVIVGGCFLPPPRYPTTPQTMPSSSILAMPSAWIDNVPVGTDGFDDTLVVIDFRHRPFPSSRDSRLRHQLPSVTVAVGSPRFCALAQIRDPNQPRKTPVGVAQLGLIRRFIDFHFSVPADNIPTSPTDMLSSSTNDIKGRALAYRDWGQFDDCSARINNTYRQRAAFHQVTLQLGSTIVNEIRRQRFAERRFLFCGAFCISACINVPAQIYIVDVLIE